MKIIGLCGNSGSGKGYVCEIFKKHDVAFIDTDKVYRESVLLNSDCVSELVEYFGSDKNIPTAEKTKEISDDIAKYNNLKTQSEHVQTAQLANQENGKKAKLSIALSVISIISLITISICGFNSLISLRLTHLLISLRHFSANGKISLSDGVESLSSLIVTYIKHTLLS